MESTPSLKLHIKLTADVNNTSNPPSQDEPPETSDRRKRRKKHKRLRSASSKPVRPIRLKPVLNGTKIVDVFCEDFRPNNKIKLVRTSLGWTTVIADKSSCKESEANDVSHLVLPEISVSDVASQTSDDALDNLHILPEEICNGNLRELSQNFGSSYVTDDNDSPLDLSNKCKPFFSGEEPAKRNAANKLILVIPNVRQSNHIKEEMRSPDVLKFASVAHTIEDELNNNCENLYMYNHLMWTEFWSSIKMQIDQQYEKKNGTKYLPSETELMLAAHSAQLQIPAYLLIPASEIRTLFCDPVAEFPKLIRAQKKYMEAVRANPVGLVDSSYIYLPSSEVQRLLASGPTDQLPSLLESSAIRLYHDVTSGHPAAVPCPQVSCEEFAKSENPPLFAHSKRPFLLPANPYKHICLPLGFDCPKIRVKCDFETPPLYSAARFIPPYAIPSRSASYCDEVNGPFRFVQNPSAADTWHRPSPIWMP